MPPLTHAALQEPPPHFDTVDWPAVLAGRFGEGDADVDGSILAARKIDESYTPLEPLPHNAARSAALETHYHGLYLGAEKIWTGDVVRLGRTAPDSNVDNNIMVVHAIVERAVATAAPLQLFLVGDIYTYTTKTHIHHPNAPFPPAGDPRYLPRRLIVDLEFRNAVALPMHGKIGQWTLTGAQVRIPVQEVKGRWYESRLLLPVLKGEQEFREDLAKGICGDAAVGLNSRLAGLTATEIRELRKVRERREVFGRAVPQSWQVGT
jgi:hypothetical protein